MTMKSGVVMGLAAVTAALIALTACSGDGSGGSSASTATSTWDGIQIPAATIALPAQTTSFDPTASVSATDRAVAALMFSSLYIPQPDGTVKPGLATGKADFNTDFTKATVHLRPATFSDGNSITAADVVATIQRDRTTKGTVTASSTALIAAVSAVDASTVEFEFSGPFPSFEGVTGVLSIYPASELKDAAAYFRAPTVTSGQYTISQGWSSNKLDLQANPKFYGGEPAVKKVTFEVIVDGNSALSQVQSGQVAFAGDLAPSYITQVATTPGVRVETTNTYGFFDLRLNNAKAPFDNANVRKAFNAVLDRKSLVQSIWGKYNTPQSGFWPQGMQGDNPKSRVTADVAQAKELLKGTPCESGCAVQMIYSNQDFAFSQQLALTVQQQLAKIGITVNLTSLDGATEVDRLFAGQFDIAPGAMTSNTNTPDQLLTLALLGTGPLKAEFTGYNSPAMNALIHTALTTSGADRKQAIDAIENQFVRDLPLATLAPWVRGSVTRLPDGVFSLVGSAALMGTVK